MKKNLIIKQHDITDCGPACLLSVIIYYGGYVPLSMIRENSFTDKTGTSAYNLIKCAEKYGLTGSGMKVSNIKNISDDKLPCIAHARTKNGLNHFVTIYEINKEYILIMDPGVGKVKMLIEEFNEIFSNIVILLHPYKKVEKLNKPKSIINLIKEIILNNKLNILLLFIISLLTMFSSIFLSYFIKIGNLIINKGLNISYLYFLFLLFLVIYIFKNLFDYIKNMIIIKFNKKISLKLFSDFSMKIFNLPLNFIRSRTSGEIVSRYNELSEVNSLLPTIILSMFLDLITSFITILFLLNISYKLTLMVLVLMIVYFIISYTFKNPTLYKINKNLDENANLNSSVIESINNLRSIKNLHNESNMRKKLDQILKKTLCDNYSLDSFYNKITFIKNLYYDLVIFFISSYGLYLLYLNKIGITDLFTFLIIVNYFSEPIKDLVDMVTKFCFIKTSINKINEFNIITSNDNGNLTFKEGDIIVNNLSYAYNGINFVINNYSCQIKKKSKVLLKGNSGSGKSTLCQILSKQLLNYEGNVFIAGNEVKNINNDSFKNNVTYIGQKDTLIVDTIENNIKYERNVDKKEFKTICRLCEIDEIINKKFNRFNNLVSESSDNISGGEKQRITLARGLINSGNILILDEPLSEVNCDMEERILKRIICYFKDKTIIYVSHKSYKNIFDQIVRI
ncbi:MAG: ATP-binding cassette domain-containing protein [Bacilli bacterium]|nr:ATP-binding cassette domain-containing protein [Bacilli bacterium]